MWTWLIVGLHRHIPYCAHWSNSIQSKVCDATIAYTPPPSAYPCLHFQCEAWFLSTILHSGIWWLSMVRSWNVVSVLTSCTVGRWFERWLLSCRDQRCWRNESTGWLVVISLCTSRSAVAVVVAFSDCQPRAVCNVQRVLVCTSTTLHGHHHHRRGCSMLVHLRRLLVVVDDGHHQLKWSADSVNKSKY